MMVPKPGLDSGAISMHSVTSMHQPHRWFNAGIALSFFLTAALGAAAAFPSRVFLNAGGRIIEHTAGDEAFALEIAQRINEVYAATASGPVAPPAVELTPTEISQHLSDYEAALCRYLNLAQPTPQMVAILARTNLLKGTTAAVEAQARASVINIQLWREADLAARLEAGVTVPGITRRADGQGFDVKPPKNLSDFSTWALPIIVYNRDRETGAALVDKKIAEARQTLAQQAQAQGARIVIHGLFEDAVEAALADSYIASKDRRWFCSGVATYVAYKVIEDKVGPEAALRYYDVDEQLRLYGDMKQVSNLEKWSLAEEQSPQVREMRANKANKVFAAEVFFNLTAMHGPELLPRLFAEIGRTKRDKASMKTVYAAFKKLVHEDLKTYLPNQY